MAAIHAGSPRPLWAKTAQRMIARLPQAALLAWTAYISIGPCPVVARTSPAPAAADIMAENAKWAAAYSKGDFAAIGMLYTVDGTLLPPDRQRATGQAAITRFFQHEYAGKQPGSITFGDQEFYGDDQMVTEVASMVIHTPDGRVKARGKQILIFLKQGGVWRLHRDIWNADPQ